MHLCYLCMSDNRMISMWNIHFSVHPRLLWVFPYHDRLRGGWDILAPPRSRLILSRLTCFFMPGFRQEREKLLQSSSWKVQIWQNLKIENYFRNPLESVKWPLSPWKYQISVVFKVFTCKRAYNASGSVLWYVLQLWYIAFVELLKRIWLLFSPYLKTFKAS